MFFSIVTPCYNSQEYIEQCILSIKNQSYSNFEHIIIDGGSTDETLNIIKKYEKSYNMRWISEKDNGMYDAINKGFRLACGEVFSWLNADDYYMPWALQSVANCMHKNSKVKWVTGIPSTMNQFGELYFRSGFRIKAYDQKCIANGDHHIRGKGAIQQESTFWRKELWDLAGEINSNFKMAGDFDLWKRFAKKEPLYTLPTILSSFRIHEGQKSSDSISYCREIREYCNWRNFLWWVTDKIFGISRIYNYRNRDMILEMSNQEDANEKKRYIKEYIKSFLL